MAARARSTVTSDQMYAWLLEALRTHPGGAADPILAQRLSEPLAQLVNASREDARIEAGHYCSVCGLTAVVTLGRDPLCLAHFDEGLRGIRVTVDRVRAAQAEIGRAHV